MLICCFWQNLLGSIWKMADLVRDYLEDTLIFSSVRTDVLLKASLQGAVLGSSTNKPTFNCP